MRSKRDEAIVLRRTCPDTVARFWSKVAKGKGCWEWQGALSPSGYGSFRVKLPEKGSVNVSAHRFAWALRFGDIQSELMACHHCDNRRCVKVDHLFLGTMQDNADDMVRKGRYGPPRRSNATLTPDQVREVRALLKLGGRPTAIAMRYGVQRRAIADIGNGVTWKEVF